MNKHRLDTELRAVTRKSRPNSNRIRYGNTAPHGFRAEKLAALQRAALAGATISGEYR